MALDPQGTRKEQGGQWSFPPSFVPGASTGQGPHRGACFQRPDKPTGLSPNPLRVTGGTKSLFMAMLLKYQAIYQAEKCHKKANGLPKPQILDGGAHREQTHPFRKEFSIKIQTDLVKNRILYYLYESSISHRVMNALQLSPLLW